MIQLGTPLQTTAPALLVVAMDFRFGVDDTGTVATLVYLQVDAQGNPIPGTMATTVKLAAADALALFTTPGSLRVRAQAALQSNLGPVASGVTT